MNKSTVTFTNGTLAQATPLWQYDYGQVLEINGLDLPATYQVHFCNCADTQTITVLGNADGVLIPDNLLQTGKTVIAYIYLHTGADDGETEYKITIPVRPRPAPSDIPPTPEQQSPLDEAIAALNSAVEDVEDIADGIPDQINAALAEAKASGEFDGPPGPSGEDGNCIWWTTDAIAISGSVYYTQERNVQGRAGATPQAKDLLVGPAPGTAGAVTYLYSVRGIYHDYVYLDGIGSIKGDRGQQGPAGPDGYSPTVTVTEIEGGHRVTITDEDGDHVFDVMDGQGGGGGTVDIQVANSLDAWQRLTVGLASSGDLIGTTGNRYESSTTRISTKPPISIEGASTMAVTVAADYKFCVYWFDANLTRRIDMTGWVTESSTYTVPSGTGKIVLSIAKVSNGTITTDDYNKADFICTYDLQSAVSALAEDVSGKYTKPSGGIPKTDLAAAVQTSLGKADSALQSAPVTSVNGQTGAVSLAIPSTAGDVGAIPAPASPSAGDVLTYSSGAWAAAAPVKELPAGGNSGAVLAKSSASDYQVYWRTISDYTAAGIIITAAATAAKVCQYSFWDDTHYPQILYITLASANTAASALTMKVNGKGPYPIYINGTASSATNYTLPAGAYLVLWDGTNFYFDTTGKVPNTIPTPASPTTGDFLCWNGSAWVAQTLSTWQGGSF